MLDVDVGPYSARTTVYFLLRSRYLCVEHAQGNIDPVVLVKVRFERRFCFNFIFAQLLYSFKLLMLDVDVGLYSARTISLCYCVQDTFVSNKSLGSNARVCSGQAVGLKSGLFVHFSATSTFIPKSWKNKIWTFFHIFFRENSKKMESTFRSPLDGNEKKQKDVFFFRFGLFFVLQQLVVRFQVFVHAKNQLKTSLNQYLCLLFLF